MALDKQNSQKETFYEHKHSLHSTTDQYATATAGAARWSCHIKRVEHRSTGWRETVAGKTPILARRFAFDSTTCRSDTLHRTLIAVYKTLSKTYSKHNTMFIWTYSINVGACTAAREQVNIKIMQTEQWRI